MPRRVRVFFVSYLVLIIPFMFGFLSFSFYLNLLPLVLLDFVFLYPFERAFVLAIFSPHRYLLGDFLFLFSFFFFLFSRTFKFSFTLRSTELYIAI
ncbi:hypothetical protein DFH27DRAFT_575028 [Peziza echinospora]|nr:hypothetical protein DFH27DRAFT_575028 [Peziza echinospora]